MFKDTQRALEELERELLREDAPKEEPKEETLVYRNYANRYGRDLRNYASGYAAYEAPQNEPEEVPHTRDEGLRGLMLTAGLLLTGIVGIALWWIFGLAGGL